MAASTKEHSVLKAHVGKRRGRKGAASGGGDEAAEEAGEDDAGAGKIR